ncbi:hypothetical protein AVEN_157204-1 [Araneus ventricosus]|uniref:Uncharacterized protein n=1 Tax=Araneus ventricosus TaxID=182803 RepID=A0A4Y2EI24_ARAVE|nr:hypothetical protein AVEN_157204-1 [Araneus ventricosus]
MPHGRILGIGEYESGASSMRRGSHSPPASDLLVLIIIIICFSSLNHNLSSSRLIRNRRTKRLHSLQSHGGISKINTKAFRRLNADNNFYHSVHTAPWTTEEFKHSISKPSYKNWKFRMHHNPRHAKVYFHHLRYRRKDKYPNQFYEKHIRDIRETKRDKVLDEVTNVYINNAPTLTYDIIPTTEGKLEKAADDLQEMRILLQNIDKKISSLSGEVKYDNSKHKKSHTLVPSEVRRRQSNVVQPSLPVQIVETLKPNIPINEISRDAKRIAITPGDPLLEISQILSLLPQNKESMDQPHYSIANRNRMNLSPNVALDKGNIDPNYVKSVLNMSLQNMDERQTLEFVANALLNNNNFIESLAKNMYMNQSATNNLPLKSNNERENSYNGELVTLIILFIISLIVIIVIVVWHFLGNPRISPNTSNISSGKGIRTTTRKPEVMKSRSKPGGLSEETESSLDMPHMSLKNIIRKSVVEDKHHAKKEATRDLIKRAGAEEYISVEGFKKWNNNWKPSDKDSKKDSIEVKRKSNIAQRRGPDSKISDEEIRQEKRIPKMSEASRKESTTSGTLDDVVSAPNVVRGDPELVLSEDKVFENRNLNITAVDLFR